ncbi:MAG TPA: hypothetical protein VKY35_00215 [Aliidiomarina sp.]|nr:hypothetical protein [Aliidiomarina sp.]
MTSVDTSLTASAFLSSTRTVARDTVAASQNQLLRREPFLDSSKSALEAAVQERAQIDYDQPAESEQRAVGHYKAIATYAQRDQLQQMVGIDVYV